MDEQDSEDDPAAHMTELLAGCPHIDRNDARCAHRFNLSTLDQTMSVCFGLFHGCALFHRINREERALHDTPAVALDASLADGDHPTVLPFINVTIHANGNAQPLRATGS